MTGATSEERQAVEWPGVLLPREELNPALVETHDRLADAAKAGDWTTVLSILDDRDSSFRPNANAWRFGGSSWYSPLHQAAWHGAPESVAEALIDRGAWRALRDASGKRPLDIATERGHHHLRRVLDPGHPRGDRDERLTSHLAALVRAAARTALGRDDLRVRPLDVAILRERGDEVWWPVPGMYGGFRIGMFWGRVHAECWSRIVDGSGQYRVIVDDGPVLVEEGFV